MSTNKSFRRLLSKAFTLLAIVSVAGLLVLYNVPDTKTVVKEVFRVVPVYHSKGYDVLKPESYLWVTHSFYRYDRVIPKVKPSLTKSGWIIVGYIRELYVPESVNFTYIMNIKGNTSIRIAIYTKESFELFIKGNISKPLHEVKLTSPPYTFNGTIHNVLNGLPRDTTGYVVFENIGNSTAEVKIDMFSRYKSLLYEQVEVKIVVAARYTLILTLLASLVLLVLMRLL